MDHVQARGTRQTLDETRCRPARWLFDLWRERKSNRRHLWPETTPRNESFICGKASSANDECVFAQHDDDDDDDDNDEGSRLGQQRIALG